MPPTMKYGNLAAALYRKPYLTPNESTMYPVIAPSCVGGARTTVPSALSVVQGAATAVGDTEGMVGTGGVTAVPVTAPSTFAIAAGSVVEYVKVSAGVLPVTAPSTFAIKAGSVVEYVNVSARAEPATSDNAHSRESILFMAVSPPVICGC